MRGWFVLFATLVVVVAAGYGIFDYFLKGFTPTAGTLSLLAFALVAGIATFFSPCSFPLMPGFLTRHMQLAGRGKATSLIANSVSAALGVLLFTSILGLAVVLLGSTLGSSLAISSATPNIFVRVYRAMVGVALVSLGVLGLRGTGIFHIDSFSSLGRMMVRSAGSSPRLEMFAYGFGYVSVGIGCAGPILTGLLLFALSFGGTAEAALAFSLFTATMVGLMLGVSLLVKVSPSTLAALTRGGPKIKSTASAVQIIVGGFLILAAYYNAIFVQLLFPR